MTLSRELSRQVRRLASQDKSESHRQQPAERRRLRRRLRSRSGVGAGGAQRNCANESLRLESWPAHCPRALANHWTARPHASGPAPGSRPDGEARRRARVGGRRRRLRARRWGPAGAGCGGAGGAVVAVNLVFPSVSSLPSAPGLAPPVCAGMGRRGARKERQARGNEG